MTTTFSRGCPSGGGTTVPRCTRGTESGARARVVAGVPGQGGSGVLAQADSSTAKRAKELRHGVRRAINGVDRAAWAVAEMDRAGRWVMVCIA